MSNPWKQRVEIGPHVLYCGDCEQILPSLDAVDCIVTDPPWRASNGSRVLRRPGDGFGVAPCSSSTSLEYGSIGVFDKQIISSFKNYAKADILVLCGYMEMGEVISALSPIRGCFAWRNSRPTPIPGVVAARDVAFIVWSGKTTTAGKNGNRWKSCVFDHASPQAGCMATERILNDDGTTGHPAQEPLGLFIDIVAPISGIVAEPYMGTGTTIVACHRHGLSAIGIEKDPAYFDIACRRIDKEVSQGKLF